MERSWATQLLPLHWLDEGAGLALWSKAPALRVFPQGWGATLSQLRDIFTFDLSHPIPSLKIRWSKQQQGAFSFREGVFRVPQSEHLPGEIRDAHFRFIPPVGRGKRVTLLLAGWGDHGYNLRMRLVRRLRDRGIGTVLLENPYHGRRIVPGRAGAPVSTVAEMGYLVRAAVFEGRALLKHLHGRGYQVGVSGFSMGGSIAAMIVLGYPHPLPTSLFATPHSPEVASLEGIFRKGIPWKQFSKVKNPEEKMRRIFRRVSLLKFAPPPPESPIIMVAARFDRIVRAKFVEALHRHWSHSELRWRPGGHVSMLFLEGEAMAQAIEDGFVRLGRPNKTAKR